MLCNVDTRATRKNVPSSANFRQRCSFREILYIDLMAVKMCAMHVCKTYRPIGKQKAAHPG